MPRPGALDNYEAYRVPCIKCGAGFTHGVIMQNGMLGNCVKAEAAVVRKCLREGKPLPESSSLHRERGNLARQWISAGRPNIFGALGLIRAAIKINSRADA